MKIVVQLLFVLFWSWLFVKFPPLLYGLYFLIFFLTINLKRNYWRLKITTEQADYYSGFNTIVTVVLGLFALHGVNDRYFYYLSIQYGFHDFYLNHAGLIEIPIYIVIVLVGLINLASGHRFPQYITDQEADYKRRQYLAELEEQNNTDLNS
jgi:hypothetical protein